MGYNYAAITSKTKISNNPAWVVGGIGGFLGSSGYRGTDRQVEIRANGQGNYKFAVFKTNVLGGVGRHNSMFVPNAGGSRLVVPKMLNPGKTINGSVFVPDKK